jgi:hypothetical protein
MGGADDDAEDESDDVEGTAMDGAGDDEDESDRGESTVLGGATADDEDEGRRGGRTDGAASGGSRRTERASDGWCGVSRCWSRRFTTSTL